MTLYDTNLTNIQTFASQFPGQYKPSCVNLVMPVLYSPWKELQFVIDCSGSTDNSRGGGRGTSRGGMDNQTTLSSPTEQPKTKIIAIAELEGVGTTIAELANKYNMTGTIIYLYSFGSSVFNCILPNSQYKVTTNENLQIELLNILDTLIVYEGGGTALLPALQKVFSMCKQQSMLVIATDGQPNTGGSVEEVCTYMKQELQKDNCPITCVIAIGAGSIQENQHMFVGNRASHVFSQNDSMEERDIIRKTIAGMNDCMRECNNLFLLRLAELAKEGVYCPACTDYSELSTTLQEYFNGTHIAKYKTVLDNNRFGDLPQFVNDTFSTMPEIKAVIVHTPFGYYFITRDRQISVIPINISNPFEGVVVTNILESFEVLLLPFDQTFGIYCKNIIIPTPEGNFLVNSDTNGWPRMRKVQLN